MPTTALRAITLLLLAGLVVTLAALTPLAPRALADTAVPMPAAHPLSHTVCWYESASDELICGDASRAPLMEV